MKYDFLSRLSLDKIPEPSAWQRTAAILAALTLGGVLLCGSETNPVALAKHRSEQAKGQIAALRKQAEEHPKDAQRWVALAAECRNNTLLREGLEAARQALSLEPGLVPALIEASRMEETPAAALVLAEKAVSLDPASAEAHTALASAARRDKQYDRAIREATAALKLQPKFYWAHQTLGVTYHAQQRTNDVEREFRQAIRCAPERATPHVSLAKTLFFMGRFQESIRSFEEALRCRPEAAEVYLYLADAAQHAGALGVGIEACQTGAHVCGALGSNQVQIALYHVSRGQLHHQAGQYREAAASFQEAVACDAETVSYRARLANSLEKAGRRKEAVKAAEAGLNLDPLDPACHYARGMALVGLRNLNGAIENWKVLAESGNPRAEALGQAIVKHGGELPPADDRAMSLDWTPPQPEPSYFGTYDDGRPVSQGQQIERYVRYLEDKARRAREE